MPHSRVGVAGAALTLAAILLSVGCSGRPKVSYKELADDDPTIRADAALRLGEARAVAAVDSLIAVLDDPVEAVRVQALLSLGQIGDKKATEAVGALAADPVSTVRIATAQSLGMLKDPASVPVLARLLEDSEGIVRIAAARALGNVPGPEALDTLMSIALGDENELVRQHVVVVIRDRRHQEAIPKLEALLQAESDLVRSNAARALGDIGDRTTMPALVRALDDPYYKVRSLSAHGLSKIDVKDAQALEAMRRRLGVEDHPMVAVDLAWNLARGGDRSSLDRIRDLLFKGQPEDVRAEAAMALGEVGDDSDLPRLETALSDKKGLVRSEAFKSIEKIKAR
ncbi:MAG TPA: HEAT repeat domain-containing protein [Candidatus Polarisedimenticolaceae bacterium]